MACDSWFTVETREVGLPRTFYQSSTSSSPETMDVGQPQTSEDDNVKKDEKDTKDLVTKTIKLETHA